AQRTLRGLQELGLARIVTRPTVLTLDGQVAYIQVDDQPNAVASDSSSKNGESAIRIELTPKLSADGRIHVRFHFSRTQSTMETIKLENGKVAPVADIMQAVTTLDIRDQETQAFTLVPHKDCETDAATLPLLAYLPVLGRLAGFGTLTNENSAWVILLTPRIVRPVSYKGRPYDITMEIVEVDANRSVKGIIATPHIVALDGCPGKFQIEGINQVIGVTSEVRGTRQDERHILLSGFTEFKRPL